MQRMLLSESQGVAALFLFRVVATDSDAFQHIALRLPLRFEAMLEDLVFEIGAAAEWTTARAAQVEMRRRASSDRRSPPTARR